MLRTLLVFILITSPVFAKGAPDFTTLKKSWEKIDSLTITKTAGDKYSLTVKKGKLRAARDLFMIIPEKPEILLWLFHGYKPDGDPYKQSPEIFIKNYNLKELSLWHNALIVIVDSGESLYSFIPDNGFPELQIYCGIYDRLTKQYGTLPVVLIGISSGAEGAVKFAPFVQKLNSVIGISGTYNFDALAADSGEHKIHLKEYGSPGEWEYEQPVKIFPALKCNIILLSEEKSIYRQQAAAAAQIRTKNKIEFIEEAGKGKSHDWDFWGSEEVIKILQRVVQGTGEFR
jgi:hypothetical protein